MKERAEGGQLSELEVMKQELLDYLADAEFGSAKNMAMRDYHSLERKRTSYRHSLEHYKKSLKLWKKDVESKLSLESNLRIEEFEFALMEHQIENRKSTVKGYDYAFAHIGITFSDLYGPCKREAEAKYDTEERIDRYADELYDQIMVDAMELLYSRTD